MKKEKKQENGFRNILIIGAIAIIFIAAIIYVAQTNPGLMQEMVDKYGLLGIFLASLIANASLFFPLPVDFVVFSIGLVSDNWVYSLIIGIVAGTGAAFGEMTGYILGLFGVKAAEKIKETKFYRIKEISSKIKNSGMIFIFLGAFTPFPFDIIGIAAGLMKYDIRRFFIAVLAGKLVRYTILAMAGVVGIEVVKWFFGLG
ncbi:MAG: VTT domain-containing protein [Candidatus Diapherotrites archaeon]